MRSFDKIIEHLVLSFTVVIFLHNVLLCDLFHLCGIIVFVSSEIVWKTSDAVIRLLLHQPHIILDLHVIDPR